MNVYCITFPNGKKYVGVETNTGKRIYSHSKCYHKDMLVTKAIKKHGWKNCKVKYMVWNCKPETCYHIERKLIKVWNLQNPQFGYNISSGGEKTAAGVKQSKETRELRRQKLLGRVPSEESKIKASKSLLNRKHTTTRRLNQSLAKNSKSFLVYKLTEKRNKLNHYDLKNQLLIGKFTGQSLCAESLGLETSKINSCLNGHRHTHKGHIFVFAQ
jgi:group I intron endonuclease